MLGDAQFVEVVHQAEILANVAALQPAGEVEGHEPADDVAGKGDGLPDDMEADLVVLRYRDAVALHDGEHLMAMAPFIQLYLTDGRLVRRIGDGRSMALIGEGGGLFRGVRLLEQINERFVPEHINGGAWFQGHRARIPGMRRRSSCDTSSSCAHPFGELLFTLAARRTAS